MATQTPADTWSMMTLTGALGHAVKSKDPDRIREARQDLAAAKVEREIRQQLNAENGVRTEDRKRLAALLLDGLTD